MVVRSKRLRFLLLGIGGLWCAFALSGCSVLQVSTKIEGDDSDGQKTSKHLVSGQSGGVSETFQKTYTAQKVKTLRVRDEMGAIEIAPGDDSKDEIHIEATKTVEDRDLSTDELKKLLSEMKITAHLDGDALVVETEHDAYQFPQNATASVTFVISVPKRLALDLRTDNSPITATGSDGGVTLRTSNGAIKLAQLGGTVDAETSNAPISLKEAQAKTTLKLVTANGSIECDEIHAASDDLAVTLQTANGAVQYAGDATSAVVHSSNGAINFEPTTFPLAKADITTNNAPVYVTLPKSLSATVDAEATNSHVYIDGTKDPTEQDPQFGPSIRRVVLNGGKANIIARTSNGIIEVSTHH